MIILSIETSCDETAVAVLEAKGSFSGASFTVLGNALYSQAHLHAEYGGVYPNLAKREHQKNLAPLTREALHEAGFAAKGEKRTVAPTVLAHIREVEFQKDIQSFIEENATPPIDLIAVTKGPGLEPALWAGISFAETLAKVWGVPIIGVNHMEGHIVSALMKKESDNQFAFDAVRFPVLSLLISGGHTELVLMKEWFEYELIGKTRDDAVGEAFDKVARIIGLPYPGGPEIDRAAQRARERGDLHGISLPRPMIADRGSDFSFSGLKTAVLYLVRELAELSDIIKENIAWEFEEAVRDVLVEKTRRALEKTGAKTLVVGGGVSANRTIRMGLEALVEGAYPDVQLNYPDRTLTGDNAIMIGAAAYMRHTLAKTLPGSVKAQGSLSLAEA